MALRSVSFFFAFVSLLFSDFLKAFFADLMIGIFKQVQNNKEQNDCKERLSQRRGGSIDRNQRAGCKLDFSKALKADD